MLHYSLSQGGAWFVLHWKTFWVLLDSSSPLFWPTCVPAPCPSLLSVKTVETTEETNPSVGRCLSASSQRAQASVPGRLNCVRAWYHQSEKRFRKQANKEKERFGFSRCLFLWSFFSRNVSLRRSALLLPSFFLFYLIGPPRRIIFSAFPWTTATKIAQVCCADLKTWQRALRNTRVFSICMSLTQPLVAPLASRLFWSPKQTFRLHPTSSESIIFLFQRMICPLSQRSELCSDVRGELCIRWLPAVRCM